MIYELSGNINFLLFLIFEYIYFVIFNKNFLVDLKFFSIKHEINIYNKVFSVQNI